MSRHLASGGRSVVAFGPEAPAWGSWDWVGADLAHTLARVFTTRLFRPWEVPDADVVVVVKHAPPPQWADCVAARAALIYAPVDFYPSVAAIDADAAWLRRCARIVIHCERLRKYFAPYAPVDYLDHHVKFAAPLRESFPPEGNLLWVGVRSNLAPLVEWVNGEDLPAPLDVLTNLEDPEHPPSPAEVGFRRDAEICIHNWSPERQIALTTAARAAIDIKGEDFRSRHKPPAKAIDFIASGLPLAMNEHSSPVEHLARFGFQVASPREPDRWLSRRYWEQTQQFGRALRDVLAPRWVALRWRWLIASVGPWTGSRNRFAGDAGVLPRRDPAACDPNSLNSPIQSQ